MAVKGKRLIFCDECPSKAQEGIATEDDILPGMLLEQSAAGFAKSTAASTVFGSQVLIADCDFLQAGTVDDVWDLGDSMVARAIRRDEYANVLVAAGQNITSRGVALASNGDGTFAIAATDGSVETKVVSDEIINVTGSAQLVRVRGA